MITISYVTLAGIAAILLIGSIAYWPCRKGAFVLDDQLLRNHPIMSGDWQRQLLEFHPLVHWKRPLTWLSFAINVNWFGPEYVGDPLPPKQHDRALFGFHLFNLWFHLACALALWAVARTILPSGAFIAALLFTVHSLSASSAAYVSGRSSILAAFFGFIAVGLMITGHPLLSVITVGAACLAKEDSVAMTGTITALGWLWSIPYFWLPLIPLALAVVLKRNMIRALLRHASGAALRHTGDIGALPHGRYHLTAFAALFTRLPQWMIGVGHAADPDVPERSTWSPTLWLAVAIVAGSLAACAGSLILTTAWLWIVLSPLAVYLILPVPDAIFEYRAYFSAGGIAVMLSYVLSCAPPAVTPLVVAAFFVRTWQRTAEYRSGTSFWKASLRQGRRDRAWINLGVAVQDEDEAGGRDYARYCYAEALAINPNLSIARSNLALMDERDGQLDKGIAGMEETVRRTTKFYQGWYFLGTMYEKARRWEDAEQAYRRAVAISPSWDMAWNRLGLITAVHHSDMATAGTYFNNALRYQPFNAAYTYNAALALNMTGHGDEAHALFQRLPAQLPVTEQMLLVKEAVPQ